eukprot:jgi/Chrzof1/3818/Cz13g09270.t1
MQHTLWKVNGSLSWTLPTLLMINVAGGHFQHNSLPNLTQQHRAAAARLHSSKNLAKIKAYCQGSTGPLQIATKN